MNETGRPKVLQIFKYYHPHTGGVEKVAQDIAEGLEGRIETKVLVCHENLRSSRGTVNGIEITRAGRLATYFSVPLAPRFPLLMRAMAKEADILHFHLPFPLSDMSYLVARPHGRVVVWWHSEIVRPKNLSKLYKPFLRQFLKKASRIVVAAPQLIDGSPLLSEFREKCRVIPIGIDVDRFRATEATAEKARGIRNKYGRRIMLFVGRLIYYKGLEYLIEAMAQLPDLDTVLLVVGEGPLGPSLKAMAAERGISGRVVFLGKLSDAELVDHYHACDLLCLPSVEKTEAFGIVQLEAMACGKPVVSTDLPTGVPFVNLHERTGIVVPPRDAGALSRAVRSILEDDSMASRFGEAGKRRVQEEFTTETMLGRMLDLYRQVANE